MSITVQIPGLASEHGGKTWLGALLREAEETIDDAGKLRIKFEFSSADPEAKRAIIAFTKYLHVRGEIPIGYLVGALKATDVTRAPGVKLVLPEEATPEMEAAAERYWQARRFSWFSDDPRTWAGVYKAMTARAVVEGQAGVIFPERKAEPVAREPQTSLNPADRLPPVACPLMIEVDGNLVKAERTEFVQHRGQDMVYRLADGSTLLGRFRWTYP